MNWRHLQAFIWLRWRLVFNQWRRAGTLNAVLMMIVAAGALVTVIPLAIGCYVLGLYAIPKAAPAHLMYAWDALIFGFVFFWLIGLVTELQRTEPLSLSKFLHLPVSVQGAFLINYISSLLRLSLIIFGPIFVAFSLALIWTRGFALAPTLAALAALLVMVTAVSYQFQGWLASLMADPRRRRTVVVATTMTVVLIAQLPNLVNFIGPWSGRQRQDRTKALADELAKLEKGLRAQDFDARELVRRREEVTKRQKLAAEQADRETAESWERTARLANTFVPLGWLPLGVAAAAEGRVLPSILGILGMTLIGSVSLWGAYRTTVGMYQGQSTGRKTRPARVDAARSQPNKPGASFLETRLPGVSEPVSAIALGGFQSLQRSPEAKLMLLSPVIMIPVFGSMLWSGRLAIPETIRPLIAVGGIVFVLFGLLPLMGNQFGFDRSGFRVFVLCSAARRDILLGKNLAFVPVAFTLVLIVLAICQAVCPMRLDHFLAMAPQSVSMFLLFCMFTNLMSILTPLPVAAGSLQASNPNMKTILIQMVMFFFLFPITQAPTLLPLGTEAALRFLGYGAGLPICLVLSLAGLVVVVILYYLSLGLLGELFQAREQKILECVTRGSS